MPCKNIEPMTKTTPDKPETVSSKLPKPQARVHLNYLDGLRALAALYVVAYHAIIHQRHLPTGLAYTLTEWMMYGHFAVDVFIVLSGFSLMLPIVRGDGRLRGGALTFFKKRARRILPPYYFALGLTLLLSKTILGHFSGTEWDQALPVSAPAIVTHVLLIHNIFSEYMFKINGVFWSIAVEWQIYFFFPVLLFLWSRLGSVMTTFIALAVGYTGVLLLRHTSAEGLTSQFLGLFALGMLGAAISFAGDPLSERLRTRIAWRPMLLVLMGVVISICHHFGGHHVLSAHSSTVDLFVGLSTTCLLIILSSSETSTMRRLLDWRPLVFIGSFAYSIYLLHEPVLQILWIYAIHPLHLSVVPTFAALLLLGGAASVAFAYLFFLACEKPFLNTRPKPPVREEPLAVEPPVVTA